MSYKTRVTKGKGSVNVTTSNTLIFGSSSEMSANERIIQNLDSTILYIAFGDDDATAGTNGEIALEQYGIMTTTFLGRISGIRGTGASSANNVSIVTL